MVRYFEAEPRRLSFFLDNSHPRLTGAGRIAAQIYWEEVRRKNPSMHDSEIYSCNSFACDETTITIGVNKTRYSVYKWARDKRRHIPGTHVMGSCMFVFDRAREAYVLVQRADNVAFDTGKISGVGGVVDYKEIEIANFAHYIQTSVEQEVGEELVTIGGLRAVSLLGFYLDPDTLKTEFAYYGEAEVSGVKAAENRRLIEVRGNQLADYAQEHEDQLEESTANHLLHVIGLLASLAR